MEAIGNSAARAMARWTGSPQHVEKSATDSRIVTRPTTDEEYRALVARIPSLPAVSEPPATANQISRHLEFMAATLPSRNMDADSGRMRFAVYARLLGEYSNEALAYMARKSCERMDWFPTPRQCVELLSEYRPPASERERAECFCHRYQQDKFEAWIATFRDGTATQETVDGASGRWRKIAMERGFLRLMPDGGFIIRKGAA